MMDEIKMEIIRQKECEIKRLKEEIKALRGENIRGLVKQNAIEYVQCVRKGADVKISYGQYSTNPTWENVRKLAMMIHFNQKCEGDGYHWGDEVDSYQIYNNYRLLQKDMSEEQKHVSACFAEETIALYNKYVKIANPYFEFDGILCNVWSEEEEAE